MKQKLTNLTEAHEAMATLGGSFVRAIAQAYALADRANGEKLEIAFADLFISYGAKRACPRTLALVNPGVSMGDPCSFAWTGRIPLTGQLRCGLCGSTDVPREYLEPKP